MQFDGLSKRLEGISDASKKGYPIRNLYRLMYMPEIWYEAYANIYSNKGAMTKGVNDNTLDGFSLPRVEKIIATLKEEMYKFAPVRRVYIPKRNGKIRPLGIPSGDDKLVQEVVRILLERVYERIFLDNSHGFRPRHSCHTALEQIQKRWTAIKWFIEFDIEGFFNNMDHEIMIRLLEKKIDDRRFIKLIRGMLKAGYIEEWKYNPTYSGTPQGGIISPILSNIYLHELDTYAKTKEIEFRKGQRRRDNPEYQRYNYQKCRLRKRIDEEGKKPELIKRLKELDKKQKTLPSKDPFDEDYRRLQYCRYADDFIFGIIGTRKDAIQIMEYVQNFIEKELKLQVSSEKTQIQSAKKGIEFLSYSIQVYQTDKTRRMKIGGRYTTKRTVTNRVRLGVPDGKAQQFCQKYSYGDWQKTESFHRPIAYLSDTEIILLYNAELSGFANYYALASDMKMKLKKLEYMANYSLFKTFAYKYKTKVNRVLKRMKQGNEHIHRYTVKGEERILKVFKLKHAEKPSKQWNVDGIPKTYYLTAPRSELVQRLNRERCEYCGSTDAPKETHHVRKLKDLKSKKSLKKWQEVMIARNRKTIVLCKECHDLLHAGKLYDRRYQRRI